MFFVPKLLIFEPCPALGVSVPTSSPNRAAFERITCLFRAQLVPFKSPDRASFEPKMIFFRAQITPISCPNRESFESYSCCYRALLELLSSPARAVIKPFRALSIRTLAVKYVARQNLAIFFSRSVSASITRRGLIHGN